MNVSGAGRYSVPPAASAISDAIWHGVKCGNGFRKFPIVIALNARSALSESTEKAASALCMRAFCVKRRGVSMATDDDLTARKFAVFAAFAVFALIAFGAVLFGVRNPPDEPGFFEGAPTWRRLPVSVSIGRYSAEGTEYTAADRKMAVDVVKRINRQVGAELFRVIEAGSLSAANAASVAVELGIPWDVGSDSEEGGRAEVRQVRDRAVGCDVVISSAVTWAFEPAVLFHELGHCVGLDDDDRPHSVMYQQADEKSVLRGFTDHDVDLLRNRYLRGDRSD